MRRRSSLSVLSLLLLFGCSLPLIAGQASSCLEILKKGNSVGDGAYTIRVNSKDVRVLCDMTNGGWTRVINVPSNAVFVQNIGAIGTGTDVNTVLSKLSDADINWIAGGKPEYQLRCHDQTRTLARVTGWTSLVSQADWIVDRDNDGRYDCTASRDQFITSDYLGSKLHEAANCDVSTHFTFGVAPGLTNQGCFYAPRGWGGAGSVWIRGPEIRPAEVQTSQAFGPLRMKFLNVDSFQLAWNDAGSGGDMDGAFYNPVSDVFAAPENAGYFFLGSYGQGGYSRPVDGWIMLVKNEGTETVVTPAVGLTQVWTDRGSGARMDGSFWRPICLSGYVPLGLIANSGTNVPPSWLSSRVGCVSTKITAAGAVGPLIYNDRGSSAAVDFSSWSTVVPSYMSQSQIYDMVIAPNTFSGWTSHAQPNTQRLPEQNVLVLPAARTELVTSFQPRINANSYMEPPEMFNPLATLDVIVPFFVVGQVDYKYPGVAEQIKNSPFYVMERLVMWTLTNVYVNDDQGEIYEEKAVTVGSSRQRTTEVMHSVGVSTSFSGGHELVGVSSTVTVSYQFSTSESSSTTLFQEVTTTRRYSIPPFSTLAEYSKSTFINVKRGDEIVRTTPPITSDQFARTTFSFDPYRIDEYSSQDVSGDFSKISVLSSLELNSHERAQLQCNNIPLCTGYYLQASNFPSKVNFISAKHLQQVTQFPSSTTTTLFLRQDNHWDIGCLESSGSGQLKSDSSIYPWIGASVAMIGLIGGVFGLPALKRRLRTPLATQDESSTERL